MIHFWEEQGMRIGWRNLCLQGVFMVSVLACDSSVPASDRQKSSETHQRLMTMDSVRNFRDLGGYQTGDGRSLRWGQIYRSAGLHEASDNDIDFIFKQLGINQVIDLRNQSERSHDVEPEAVTSNTFAQYTPIDILVVGTARDDLVAMLNSDEPEKQDFAALLQRVNEQLALEHQQDMKQWFDILLSQTGPFLFHCTEGKDRTGFAAAMLLSVLGVDRQTIYEDYLLTNAANAGDIEQRINKAFAGSLFQVSRQQLRQLLMVEKAYLQAGFEAIERDYGNIDVYLEKALNLTADKRQLLRDKFLQ